MNSYVYFHLSSRRSKIIKALYFSIASLAILSISLRSTIQTIYATSHIQQYDEFWQQNSIDFQHWSLNGVVVQTASQPINVQLTPSQKASCSSLAIDGGAVNYNNALSFCTGKDPYAPKSYNHGQNYYNGGSFYFGTLTSPPHVTRQPITTLLASWNADTPVGTWLEIHIRVMEKNSWTHWYKLPIWANDISTIKRHSINEQSDITGSIQTDTFVTAATTANAYQLSVTLFSQTPVTSPHLTRMSIIASYDTNANSTPAIPPDKTTWGSNLLVPQRSQMLTAYQGTDFGGGGEAWCSSTSISMVLAYWSYILQRTNLQQTVPEAAKASYDYTYQGTGNWPFNTAYAATFGLKTFVTNGQENNISYPQKRKIVKEKEEIRKKGRYYRLIRAHNGQK